MTQMELDPQAVPAPESPGATPIIEMTDISIAFGGVRALSDVSLRLFPGEVHALMGENGAGKSTMIKALTGVYTIDAGTITVAGEQHEFSSPAESQSHPSRSASLLSSNGLADKSTKRPTAPDSRRRTWAIRGCRSPMRCGNW